MKQFYFILIFMLTHLGAGTQKEFHVFPDINTSGNVSFQNPWDLQTALSQLSSIVNGGDIIWILKGA
jgi:hypothetical protein